MSEAATVRDAKPADVRGIQRVARASWHAAYDPIIGTEQVDDIVDSWYDPERLVDDDVRPDERPLYVAEVDGDVVGFIEAAPREDAAELYRFYVDPEHWGNGIGTELLDRLEATLADRGVDRLRLTVLAGNDVGVSFYESRGFDRIAEGYDEQFDARRFEYRKRL